MLLGYRRIQLVRRTHTFNGSIAPTHAWGTEVQIHVPHNGATGSSGTRGQGATGVVRKKVQQRTLFLLIKRVTGFQTPYNNQRNSSVITYRCILVDTSLCHKKVIATLHNGKGKWSLLQAYVALRVGRGIALLFHDRGTRRGWVVSSTLRPHFTPGKDPVPILQQAVWAPGPVWTGRKSRPHRDSISDGPARSQSLYLLSNPAHPHYIAVVLFETIR